MYKPIPVLANTADEVLKSALNYDYTGYSLIFDIVGEGIWQFHNNSFEKILWHGNIPLIDWVENDLFDSWLLNQISKGYVTIKVQSSGKNPYFSKEIHRARGISTPLK